MKEMENEEFDALWEKVTEYKQTTGGFPTQDLTCLNPETDKEEVEDNKKAVKKEGGGNKKKKKGKGGASLEVVGPGKSTHEFRTCIEK